MTSNSRHRWITAAIAGLALAVAVEVAVVVEGDETEQVDRSASVATSLRPAVATSEDHGVPSRPGTRTSHERTRVSDQPGASSDLAAENDRSGRDRVDDAESKGSPETGYGDPGNVGDASDPDYADGVDVVPDDGYEGTDGGASFGAEFLGGQWYSEPSYGGAETYTVLTADYDGAQRGGRAYWPNGVVGSALTMPITGGNEFPFLWELSGDLLTIQFYSGRVESYRVLSYDPAAHEMWVDDGAEVRMFIGCRSPRWPLPGATAPGC